MLNFDSTRFEYIKPLAWQDVFEIWRMTEVGNPNWEAHYRERGFHSWEEWRQKYAEPLKGMEREWHLYKILNPIQSVPEFLGGPIKGWQEKYYGGKNLVSFRELAQHPGIQ